MNSTNAPLTAEVAMEGGDMPSEHKYIPKQFDYNAISKLPQEEKEFVMALITSPTNIFREETATTLRSYGVIIDRREGDINKVLNND